MKTSNQIDYILQHITSLLSRDSDQILLEQLGIGYSQFKILRVINNGLPVKQRFIADTLGQTEASISRQIDLLLDKKLVSKNVDPNSKRVRLIRITEKGKKITEATTEVLERYHRNILSKMNEKQQVDFLKNLENFHINICQADHSLDPDYITYLVEN